MSEDVIFFQLGIFATILITRLIWKNHVVGPCLLWSLFTFAMVYDPSLILLQLSVIWGSFWLLVPKKKQAKVKTEQRPTQGQATGTPGFLALMDNFVTAVEKGAHDLEVMTAKKLDVSRSIDKLKLAISIEKSRIDMALDVANTEIKKGLNVSTSEWSFHYRKIKAAREASNPSQNQSPKSPTSHLAYLQLEAAYIGNPEIYPALKAMKESHDTYLESIFKTLMAKPDLPDLFFDAMEAIGGDGNYVQLKSDFDRYAPVYRAEKTAAEELVRANNEALFRLIAQSKAPGETANAVGSDNSFTTNNDSEPFPASVKFLERIDHIYHFTNLENIESILSNGLMPIDLLEQEGVDYARNDGLRLDGHLGAISLSIGHPNEKLLYRWRMSDWAIDWVVLQISPRCLIDHTADTGLADCAFYPWNAADKKAISLEAKKLGTQEAFNAMFENEVGEVNRADQILVHGDPTDVQAEILKFGKIDPKFIKKAIFKDRSTLEKWREHFDGADIPVELDTTGVFGLRSKARLKAKAKVH